MEWLMHCVGDGAFLVVKEFLSLHRASAMVDGTANRIGVVGLPFRDIGWYNHGIEVKNGVIVL